MQTLFLDNAEFYLMDCECGDLFLVFYEFYLIQDQKQPLKFQIKFPAWLLVFLSYPSCSTQVLLYRDKILEISFRTGERTFGPAEVRRPSGRKDEGTMLRELKRVFS